MIFTKVEHFFYVQTFRQKNAAVKLPRHFYLFVSFLISVPEEAEEV